MAADEDSLRAVVDPGLRNICEELIFKQQRQKQYLSSAEEEADEFNLYFSRIRAKTLPADAAAVAGAATGCGVGSACGVSSAAAATGGGGGISMGGGMDSRGDVYGTST